MTHLEDREGMRIGEVLKNARTRQGVEIREVEERTKIRTKYLRALESEDWEVLPNLAYARGFLRTYAQLLGLDADAVVDEFRRQVEREQPAGNAFGRGEPVLEGRRRLPGSDPRRGRTGALIAGGLVVAVAALVVVGLLGGEEGADDRRKRGERAAERKREQRQERAERRERAAAQAPEEPASVTLHLVVNEDLQVCLLGAGEEVLIPGSLLSAGTEERFEQPRFELRFPSGYDVENFSLELDGERARVEETVGPAAFEIEPGEPPRPTEPPGTQCP